VPGCAVLAPSIYGCRAWYGVSLKRYQIDPDIQICTFLRQTLLALCFHSVNSSQWWNALISRWSKRFTRLCKTVHSGGCASEIRSIKESVISVQHSLCCMSCAPELKTTEGWLKRWPQALHNLQGLRSQLGFFSCTSCLKPLPISILQGWFGSSRWVRLVMLQLTEGCIRLNSVHCTACGLAFAYLLMKCFWAH